MPRTRHSLKEKIDLLAEYNNSNISVGLFSKEHGIDSNTFRRWINLFKRDGIDGLKERTKNNRYSQELKLNLVKDYHAGKGSLEELTLKYGLRNVFQAHDWLIKYNNGKLLAKKSPRRKSSVMKRKTTIEERIKIVKYIENNHTYNQAAETFSVSYQQARLWFLKVKNGGYDALKDGRGHRKAEEDLTDLDKANRRIKQLEAELEEKKLIEAFAKKLQELQHKG